MKRKFLSIMLCVAMVSTMLAGCGAKTENVPADTPVKTEETTEETQSEESTTGSKLSGEVVYWSMWNESEPQAEIFKTAIADFEAANPDCKVTVEWTGREVKNLVLPAMESGTKLDIFDSDPMALYTSDPSKILQLDEFYALKSLDGTGTIKDSMISSLVDWDASLSAQKGLTGTHSVPYVPHTVTWFYNKDLFEKAGISAVPTTWAEFDEVCAKLTAAGIAPITVDDAYMTLIYAYYLQRALGTEGTSELATTGKDLWKDPMVAQCVNDLADFASKGYFSKNVATNKYPAGQSEFAMGNAAMYFNASWFPAEVQQIAGPDFPWGQFAYPEVANGVGKITENTIGGQAFMVNANTENKEAAFELLKYFLSEKTQNEFLKKGLVPCTANTDWPAEVADQKAIVSAITENVNWGASFSSDFTDGVAASEFIKVITGKQTAEQCIETLIKESAKY